MQGSVPKAIMTRFKKKYSRRLALVLIPVAILSLIYFLWVPDISKLNKENPKKTSFMQLREKEWREKGQRTRINQKWAPLSRISPYLIKAVLIAEDDKFWSHEGFDYEAIQKAIEKDIKSRKFKFGGSTISQQLARNLYLSPGKNPLRKIAEAFMTWRMERVLTKRRILELYLNLVEWGEGLYGAEAASKHYYGKPSSELTPHEAARLAAVLPNPRRYSPVGNQRYVVSRSNVIYNIMIQRGIVVPEYEGVAGDENLPLLESPDPLRSP